MEHKKANGECASFKRQDERWSAQAYVNLSDGTTKRICITNRDQYIAKDKLREAQEKISRNVPHQERYGA